ncbi:MAG: FkbM family methyltransferase [Saprospiraceae bacterium]|nr:FkbM family methyltransferase [Saprospiraceae bacterium]MDW8483171.1 FkbM family methyltransferase [Saprospiraceae bacterium]
MALLYFSLSRWADRFLRYGKGIVPRAWRMPVRTTAYFHSPEAEPELRYLHCLCKHFRTAVDVGANHGYYAYRMARLFEQVYAFEANTFEDFDLWHYRRTNLHVFPYGLSDRKGLATLYVPVCEGRPLAGWASIERRTLSFAQSFQEIQVRVERLDDQAFVQERPIDLIKLDVEGSELNVLRGGEQVIRRDRPVLIIEDNPEQRTELRAWLEALGYQSLAPKQWMGKKLSSPNLVWVATT